MAHFRDSIELSLRLRVSAVYRLVAAWPHCVGLFFLLPDSKILHVSQQKPALRAGKA